MQSARLPVTGRIALSPQSQGGMVVSLQPTRKLRHDSISGFRLRRSSVRGSRDLNPGRPAPSLPCGYQSNRPVLHQVGSSAQHGSSASGNPPPQHPNGTQLSPNPRRACPDRSLGLGHALSPSVFPSAACSRRRPVPLHVLCPPPGTRGLPCPCPLAKPSSPSVSQLERVPPPMGDERMKRSVESELPSCHPEVRMRPSRGVLFDHTTLSKKIRIRRLSVQT